MTITGDSLLTRVRYELNDAYVVGEEPKWPTAELMIYANDGVRDYSKHFQRQLRVALAADTVVAQDDGSYLAPMTLPVFRVLRVGYQSRNQMVYIKDRDDRPGDTTGAVGALRLRSGGTSYGGFSRGSYELTALEGATDDAVGLRLNFKPQADSSVVVDYLAMHTLFDVDDLTVATTVPDEDEELISLYTTAKAWNRVGGQDAALSRWDETGKRNDSPIIPREWRLFAAYRLKLNQKLAMPRALRLRRV